MKRIVEHIYNLSAAEVVEAFRWFLTARELRMPQDDKECKVTMIERGGASVKFTEEIQDTHSEPGELRWERTSRMAGPPKEGPPDGIYRSVKTDGI